MSSHPYADPEITPDTVPFWKAAGDGKFLLPRCRSCGEAHWYPRPFCPFCYGEVDLVEASGRATLYSYSHTATAKPPYWIAYVKLEEGPLAMTRLEGVDPDNVRIGMPLVVGFVAAEAGQAVPVFRPAD